MEKQGRQKTQTMPHIPNQSSGTRKHHALERKKKSKFCIFLTFLVHYKLEQKAFSILCSGYHGSSPSKQVRVVQDDGVLSKIEEKEFEASQNIGKFEEELSSEKWPDEEITSKKSVIQECSEIKLNVFDDPVAFQGEIACQFKKKKEANFTEIGFKK